MAHYELRQNKLQVVKSVLVIGFKPTISSRTPTNSNTIEPKPKKKKVVSVNF